MTETKLERPVILRPPGDGAYRVTIVGAQTDDVINRLVTGGNEESTELARGDYTAFVESVSSTGNTVTTFSVPAEAVAPAVVELGPDPDQDSSSEIHKIFRPSRGGQDDFPLGDVYSNFFKAARPTVHKGGSPASGEVGTPKPEVATSLPEGRLFVIGVSADTAPLKHGGWRATAVETRLEHASPGETSFIVLRPPSWRRTPRLRLTISVAGDTAWRVGLPLYRDGIRLTLRPTGESGVPDLLLAMRPVDERQAVIVGGLQRALPGEIDQLVQEAGNAGNRALANDVLDQKMEDRDPWAAVAAALLLVRSGRADEIADLVFRLAYKFKWLPDASVAAARVEIIHQAAEAPSSEARCLDRLIDARQRGAPYYSLSNNLALEMLTMLSISSHSSLRKRANQERAAWSTRSRRALRTGAFFSWELPAGELTSAALPPSNYGVLASGFVSPQTVTLSV